jgi:carboxymethylenebutenolidase
MQNAGPDAGSLVTVATPTGDVPTYLVRAAVVGPRPGVVVLHDAVGMTADLRRQADWLSGAGFDVAAPDLLGGGTILRCLRDIVRDVTRWQGRLFEQVDAVRAHLADDPDSTGRIGLVGFCMGGGFALALAPPQFGFSAVSANYGMLPKDAAQFFEGACPIVASYGRRDLSLRGAAATLETALATAGVPHDVHEYPEAGHGFLNDHDPGDVPAIFLVMGRLARTAYHEPSALDARRRIEAFFRTHLG